ncbi:MAG TPA: hypothetical protein VIM56_05630 [Rhizomicrobium sp.]
MKKFEIHVSATTISADTISALHGLGFDVDHFLNCRNSIPPTFHATYRGSLPLPNEELWQNLVALVANDRAFSGIIEEEEAEQIEQFQDAHGTCPSWFSELPTLAIQTCPPGTYKACDVHIRVALDGGGKFVELLQTVGTASFDREKNGRLNRVFTATFPTLEAGRSFFQTIRALVHLADSDGQVKLEKTRRFIRVPSTAIALPITLADDLALWLSLVDRIKAKVPKSEFAA